MTRHSRFTQWRIITKPPLPSSVLDPDNLHESKGDAIIATIRLIFEDRGSTALRPQAEAWQFTWQLMRKSSATFGGVLYSVRAVTPRYFSFASSEGKEGSDDEPDGTGEG